MDWFGPQMTIVVWLIQIQCPRLSHSTSCFASHLPQRFAILATGKLRPSMRETVTSALWSALCDLRRPEKGTTVAALFPMLKVSPARHAIGSASPALPSLSVSEAATLLEPAYSGELSGYRPTRVGAQRPLAKDIYALGSLRLSVIWNASKHVGSEVACHLHILSCPWPSVVVM